jgi:error-prone DNA polymerase
VEAARRENGRFEDLDDFVARLDGVKLPAGQRYRLLVQLASSDAFASLGLTRRDALWEVAALRKRAPQLFGEQITPAPAGLPPMSAFEHMLEDFELMELSLRAHPMEFIREEQKARGVITAAQFRESAHGRKVEVAGRIINRQHPETANGIVFMTLEDETDVANIVVTPNVLERFRKVAIGDNMVAIRGQVERAGDVIHLKAASFRSLMARFAGLRTSSRDFH